MISCSFSKYSAILASLVSVGSAFILPGCSGDSGQLRPQHTIAPNHHEYPSGVTNDMVVYGDNGIVCVRDYSYYVQPSLAGLWTLRLSTGERTRLAATGGTPRWSDAAQRLVFTTGHLYTIALDGTDFRSLDLPGHCFFPAWSPDGSHIAYDSDADGSPGVWIARSDGSDSHQIIANARMPFWHPNGSQLVYVATVASAPGDYLFSSDTSGVNRQQLTKGQRIDTHPSYSRDGLNILFQSQDLSTGLVSVWVVNHDGGNPRQVTDTGCGQPAWFGDSSIVYISRSVFPNDRMPGGVLWRRNLSDGTATQLASQWDSGDCVTSQE